MGLGKQGLWVCTQGFSSSYCMGLDGHNAGKTLTRGTFFLYKNLITIGMKLQQEV